MLFYVSLMATTKQNPMVDTQNVRRKESEHTITKKKKNHETTKRAREEKNKGITKH